MGLLNDVGRCQTGIQTSLLHYASSFIGYFLIRSQVDQLLVLVKRHNLFILCLNFSNPPKFSWFAIHLQRPKDLFLRPFAFLVSRSWHCRHYSYFFHKQLKMFAEANFTRHSNVSCVVMFRLNFTQFVTTAQDWMIRDILDTNITRAISAVTTYSSFPTFVFLNSPKTASFN